jgi:hypothetical protein
VPEHRLHLTTTLVHRGAIDCTYGSPDCSPCVDDVARAFERLPERASGKFRYRSNERHALPPMNRVLTRFNFTDHVQSLNRLPGIGDEQWLVATRSQPNQPNGRAGFFLVHMNALPGNGGEAFSRFGAPDPNAQQQRTRFYHPMFGTDHPGGAQLLGRTLVIGAECAGNHFLNRYMGECSGAFVDFYQIHRPDSVEHLRRLWLDGSRGEPRQFQSRNEGRSYATAVATTRLADGRVLVFVSGKDRIKEGWFYVSPSADLRDDSEFEFLQYWHHARSSKSQSPFGTYQNLSFVNECSSGNVFLVGMGESEGVDRVDLFRLVEEMAYDESAENVRLGLRLDFEPVKRRTLEPHDGDYCSVRAGSGIHITPSGNLVVYCSTHNSSKGMLNFEEYADQGMNAHKRADASLGALAEPDSHE